jgi:hypothetical protein
MMPSSQERQYLNQHKKLGRMILQKDKLDPHITYDLLQKATSKIYEQRLPAQLAVCPLQALSFFLTSLEDSTGEGAAEALSFFLTSSEDSTGEGAAEALQP